MVWLWRTNINGNVHTPIECERAGNDMIVIYSAIPLPSVFNITLVNA